ncbi:MAG TPA: hypothetical protein VG370_34800 [Chloroflexota bacterium]|jgi:orotidine-5'-phosphate decarboxylase|nr:hypothetical protein [Chloroflexota bacterium]
MTTDGLIRELVGTVCRCGRPKAHRQTFCKPCYFALPPPVRAALYRGIGEGYEEAYADAVAALADAPRVGREGTEGPRAFLSTNADEESDALDMG